MSSQETNRDTNSADTLALNALVWVLQEPARADRFLGLTGLSGDDIRYNEGPQATNKMAAAQVGWFGKGFVTKRLGLLVTISKVISGRNVGESLTWTAGATYFLDINKKAEETK